VFFVSGGAGRIIASIPAFEIYEKENPQDDFIIVCEGGMDFYKGHPTLYKRSFDVWHKDLFENYIKDRNVVTPEPYRLWEYYNQKCSLAQAFDITISNKGLREVTSPKIYHNKHEIVEAHQVIQEVKYTTGLDKVLIVQPFGRTAENRPDFVIDSTSRSFTLNDTIKIVNELKKDYSIIVMSEFSIAFTKDGEEIKYPIAMPQIPNLRIWSAMIEIADHFLGCDSVGQHMAKAVGTTATVVIGSTFPINTSYPGHKEFDIIDVGKEKRVYSPIRLTGEEEQNRLNDEIMELNDNTVKKIINSVKTRLGKSIHCQKKLNQQSCPTHGVIHNKQQNQPTQTISKLGK
jgi:hypothetical protein